MGKFKHQLFINNITEEQINEIVPELQKLGYSNSYNFSTMRAKYNAEIRNLEIFNDGSFGLHRNKGYESLNILKYDKELILALAATREDDEFHVGEKVIIEGHTSVTAKELRGQLCTIKKNGGHYLDLVEDTRNNGIHTYEARKATAVEIIQHFSKPRVESVAYSGPELVALGKTLVFDDNYSIKPQLPEKFGIKGPLSKEVLAILVKDYNLSSSLDGKATSNYYLSERVGDRRLVHQLHSDFTELTGKEFLKLYHNKQMESKKLVGYKTKVGLPELAVGTEAILPLVGDSILTFIDDSTGRAYSYPRKTCEEQSEFFEPIYKETKPTSIEAIIQGSNKSQFITIRKGIVNHDGTNMQIGFFRNLLTAKNDIGYSVFSTSWTIGCVHDVKREELQRLLDLHDKTFL